VDASNSSLWVECRSRGFVLMSWSIQHLAVARDRRSLHRFGTILFDQQMWCWGRDVIRPEGNLLCAWGFARYYRDRPESSSSQIWLDGNPEQKISSSGYFMIHDSGVWIGLWGWGMLYGTSQDGGLFLRRFGFDPVWLDVTTLPRDIDGPEDVTCYRGDRNQDDRPRLRRLFSAALRWIAEYERWVLSVAGLSYREACVEQWPKDRCPARDMATAWDILAKYAPTAYFGGWVGSQWKGTYWWGLRR